MQLSVQETGCEMSLHIRELGRVTHTRMQAVYRCEPVDMGTLVNMGKGEEQWGSLEHGQMLHVTTEGQRSVLRGIGGHGGEPSENECGLQGPRRTRWGRGASLGLELSRKLAGQGSLRCRNRVDHFSRACLVHFNLFHPHTNPVRKILLFSPLYK